MRVLRGGASAAVLVGALLMALNLYGLAAGIRQSVPEPRLNPPAGERDRFSGSLFQRRGEPDDAYFRRLTTAVHYRLTYSTERYVVPAYENWLLRAAAVVAPSYRDYEYADYRRALGRGAGICTQYAAAVFDILKRQGIQRRVVEFVHHTVVEARTRSGRELVLDPTFGLVLPLTIAEIRRHPSIVRPYYGRLDRSRTWAPEGASLADTGQRALSGPVLAVLVNESTPQRAEAERIAYELKWPAPLALILGGVLVLGSARRRLKRSKTSEH